MANILEYHICAVYCSMFLAAHGINFRSRSGKYEEKWKITIRIKKINGSDQELRINVDENCLNTFNTYFEQYREQISCATINYPFNWIYQPPKTEDDCQLTSGFISDDTVKFYKYYENLPNDVTNFNILLEELNSIDKIKNLINLLRVNIQHILRRNAV